MKIKRIIKILETVDGFVPSDMKELDNILYESKSQGKDYALEDMDFVHFVRAFIKMNNYDSDLDKSVSDINHEEDIKQNYVRKDVYEMLFDKCERLEAKLSDLRSDINAPRYTFSEVPNNMYGQSFVTAIKEYINRDRYKVRVRGQYLDHDKMDEGETWKNFEREVPLDRAKCIRVYLDEKK